jgi:8-oxo-dGTP pyrophosphatase MutT (NUDIX family)
VGVLTPSDEARAQVADAVQVLTAWSAPTGLDDEARRRVLSFLDEHGAAAASRALRSGHLTASAVLLDASHGQVLLTLHALSRRWQQLGGHLEPGDASLAEAAAREAVEESGIAGIAVDPTPLAVDWHEVRCRDVSGEPGPSAHLDTTFLAVAPPGADHRISDESLALRWFDLDALPETTDDTVRRCVEAALRRRGESTAGWVRHDG